MNPDIIAKVAERKIQEAIEEGKFDDLPGKGKPIEFDDDPMTPSHLRMANKILKNAGVLPDWMQVRKEIIAEREEAIRLRPRLIRDGEARAKHLSGDAVRSEGKDHRIGIQETARDRYQTTGKGGVLPLWARATKLFGSVGRTESGTIGETEGEDIGRSNVSDPSQ